MGGKQRQILGGSKDNNGVGSKSNKKGKSVSEEPIPINIKGVRAFCNGGNNKYIVSFMPLNDINEGFFELTIIGDSSDIEYAPVLKAIDKNTGKSLPIIQDKDIYKVEIKGLKQNQKSVYEVFLKYNDRCALEVNVYEHKVA